MRPEHFLLNLIHDPLDVGFRNRAFEAGPLQPGENFLVIPRNTPTVFFYDVQPNLLFDLFVGGESFVAVKAFTPATDGAPRITGPGINDL
jgi:hypothetical protein